ncbi:MAG: NifU family protein [Myxococcota bacterium]
MSDHLPERGTERSLEQLVADLERLEQVTVAWDDGPRGTLMAMRQTLEAIQAEAFRRLIRTVKEEPGGMAGLRRAVDDPWVLNVLSYHGLLRRPEPSIEERVEAALESVRPMLAQHDGNVELVEVVGAEARVRLVGSCDGCAFQDATLQDGIASAVTAAVPEIERVTPVAPSVPKLVQIKRGDGSEIVASPFRRPWHDAADADMVPEGGIVAIELDAASVLLTKHRGEVKAYPNACTHLGMPLDGGEVENGVLRCPYHAFEYRLASGECLTAPDIALVSYPTRVENGRVQVQVVA